MKCSLTVLELLRCIESDVLITLKRSVEKQRRKKELQYVPRILGLHPRNDDLLQQVLHQVLTLKRIFFLWPQPRSYIVSQDEYQYTIEKLEKLMKEMNDDEDLSFTRITLKNKLKEHYGEQMIVTSTGEQMIVTSTAGLS